MSAVGAMQPTGHDKPHGTGSIVPALAKNARTGHPQFRNGKGKPGNPGHPAYWHPKLERNRVRDAEHLKALRADGWRCLILWECQLSESGQLRRRISKFLG
jgi:hypothetical protein